MQLVYNSLAFIDLESKLWFVERTSKFFGLTSNRELINNHLQSIIPAHLFLQEKVSDLGLIRYLCHTMYKFFIVIV